MDAKFIVIDGSTGSGKSTINEAVKDWAHTEGLKQFDLTDWSQTHDAPPAFDDVKDFDVIFTFEPTKNWIGSAIRYEMSGKEKAYTGVDLAHAFALDRLVMYNRLIIPALEAGKLIIQDRSVTSSIAIQPALPNGPDLDLILNLPGNALALKYAPTDLILTDLPAEIALERIASRSEFSKGVFEDLELLKKVEKRFKSDWYHKIFTDQGTKIHTIDANVPLVNMKKDAVELINKILNS